MSNTAPPGPLVPESLKRVRADVGISQAELATRAGISIGYIGMIELGQRRPTADVIRRLAEALGVAVELITTPLTLIA